MNVAPKAGPTEVQNTLKSMTASDAPKGHPRGLYFLFLTEMWERFGYYGMRALLMLYMTNYLMWKAAEGFEVYKWYTSLVYLTPLAGGFIADRLLGLRVSVLLGGVLMAAGYFMLTIQTLFFPALGLIIIGNGFFKPNISTMVGKMYRTGDARRDGAFTIFYMGINMGALFAPLICGYLAENFAPKYGFLAAAAGMVVGIGIFLSGQARVNADIAAAGNDLKISKADDKTGAKPNTGPDVVSAKDEAGEPGAGGIPRIINRLFPLIMIGLAVGVPVYFTISIMRGESVMKDAIMPVAFGLISGGMGATLLTIKGAARDRSTVIFVLFVFAVLFWMAFEQAGSALNIWADVHTDRAVFGHTYPASWWQSGNAVLIVALAPVFAMLWLYLARSGREPSTPTKMFLAMVFIALSFFAMVGAAASENATETRVAVDALPSEIVWDGEKMFVQGKEKDALDAKRLSFDPAKHELVLHGVLPAAVVNDALGATTTAEWRKEVARVEEASKKATEASPVNDHLALPAGFESPLDAAAQKAKGLSLQPDGDVTFKTAMDAPTKVAMISAGAPSAWRKAVSDLATKSNLARVSGFWLFLSYFLATLGELCLSPVGLSMVTKLAPVRFASLFMGVWLLASSLAQYLGGAIGESLWGTVTPGKYFMIFVWTSAVGVAILVLFVRPLRKLMHQVH